MLSHSFHGRHALLSLASHWRCAMLSHTFHWSHTMGCSASHVWHVLAGWAFHRMISRFHMAFAPWKLTLHRGTMWRMTMRRWYMRGMAMWWMLMWWMLMRWMAFRWVWTWMVRARWMRALQFRFSLSFSCLILILFVNLSQLLLLFVKLFFCISAAKSVCLCTWFQFWKYSYSVLFISRWCCKDSSRDDKKLKYLFFHLFFLLEFSVWLF